MKDKIKTRTYFKDGKEYISIDFAPDKNDAVQHLMDQLKYLRDINVQAWNLTFIDEHGDVDDCSYTDGREHEHALYRGLDASKVNLYIDIELESDSDSLD